MVGACDCRNMPMWYGWAERICTTWELLATPDTKALDTHAPLT